ncbi:hypothetical protein JG688_00008325 [Phytophthora aleatoria]|uniref:Uncharacterized protein n=1 Tax=Phytophthora aleatoria TaxID=2496075 RepID=A0A8J5M7H1_9STRA|nr:hypothetical protein JG688_00008325 [Phytophthora aleatoria]
MHTPIPCFTVFTAIKTLGIRKRISHMFTTRASKPSETGFESTKAQEHTREPCLGGTRSLQRPSENGCSNTTRNGHLHISTRLKTHSSAHIKFQSRLHPCGE